MKETRMPPMHAANLVANSGNALYGVYSIWASIHLAVRRRTANSMKSRSREIVCYNDSIVLTYDRHLGSAAAEVIGKSGAESRGIET